MHSVLAVGAMIAAPTARTGQMFWTPILGQSSTPIDISGMRSISTPSGRGRWHAATVLQTRARVT